MVAHAKTKEEKLYQLGHILETIRGTFFRQAMFAEFELRTHDALEKGEPMSGARMTEIYCDLLRRYHGDAEGIVKIDPAYCVEWAYIPHFYRPFYVYQYATSLAASAFFTEAIEKASGPDGKPKDGGHARDTYLAVLKAGGSDYPHALLLKAGLDLTTPAPYQALLRRMNAVMDQMEALL
jgi:oligoendopeptidase F